MNYTLAEILQTTRSLPSNGSSDPLLLLFLSAVTLLCITMDKLVKAIVSLSCRCPERQRIALTHGCIPGQGGEARRICDKIQRDQLLSILKHSPEKIVHICPVIKHERARTLFYSC